MNEMQVFQYEDNEVRTVEQGGEVWWVLPDVCRVLEIKNPTDVQKRLDEDERARFNLGRQGETNIINESGLYKVILRSNKPEAKKFTRWVTHEVLPSIRRTGSYSQPGTQTVTMEQMVQLATAMATIATAMENIMTHLTQPGEQPPTMTAAWRANYHSGPRKKVVVTPPGNGILRMETFPPDVLSAVNSMMEQMVEEQTLNFSEIARYCNKMGCTISNPSVRRYYDKYYNQH